MSSGKVLLGVLGGVAVGAALGILFAPDKGSSTRKKILRKGNKLTDDLEVKFNELIESLSRKFESVKEETSLITENGKTTAGEAIDDVTAERI